MIRNCANPDCRAPIAASNGFVIARDFLAFEEGKLPAEKVRELCGKCNFKFLQSGDTKAFEELLVKTNP